MQPGYGGAFAMRDPKAIAAASRAEPAALFVFAAADQLSLEGIIAKRCFPPIRGGASELRKNIAPLLLTKPTKGRRSPMIARAAASAAME